jgi:hypothetical protein
MIAVHAHLAMRVGCNHLELLGGTRPSLIFRWFPRGVVAELNFDPGPFPRWLQISQVLPHLTVAASAPLASTAKAPATMAKAKIIFFIGHSFIGMIAVHAHLAMGAGCNRALLATCEALPGAMRHFALGSPSRGSKGVPFRIASASALETSVTPSLIALRSA